MATVNTNHKKKSSSKYVSKENKAKHGMRFSFWLSMRKSEQAEHLHFLRSYLIAPFLIEMYSFQFSEKVLGWLKETGLLEYQIIPRSSQTLTERQLEVAECAEDVMNIFLPILNRKQCVKDFSDIATKVEQAETLSDVILLMRPPFVTYFLRKVLDKRVPGIHENFLMLLIASLLIRVVNYLNEIEEDHSCGRLTQFKTETKTKNANLETLQKKGNRFFRSCQFRSAIAMYTKAIEISPFNGILYGNRAQSYLNICHYWEALSDARRAVFLNPNWDKAYYRYAAACFELGYHGKAVQLNFLAQEICSRTKELVSQEDRFRKHNTKDRSRRRIQEIESWWFDPQFRDMPELESQSDSDSDSDCDSMCCCHDSSFEEEVNNETASLSGDEVESCKHGETSNSGDTSPFLIFSKPVESGDVSCESSDDDNSFFSIPESDCNSTRCLESSLEEDRRNEVNSDSSSSDEKDDEPRREVGTSNSENASPTLVPSESVSSRDVSCMCSEECDSCDSLPELEQSESESDNEQERHENDTDQAPESTSDTEEEAVFLAQFHVFTELFLNAIASQVGEVLITASGSEGAEVDTSTPGVVPGVIESLPKVPVTQKHIDAGKCCSICHCEYEKSQDLMLLPCKHNYHEACITKWLKMHATCPTCRYVLPH